MSARRESGETDRDAFVVDVFGGAAGLGVLSPPGIERDDGVDAFGEQEFIIAESIVSRIVNGGLDREFQAVLFASFVESVEAFEREGEIAFTGLGDRDVKGQ